MVVMNPGRFWLGDPCYFNVPSFYDSWSEVCEKFESADPLTSNFQFDHLDRRVLIFSTRYGDGEYRSNYDYSETDHHIFGVDSGLLGLIEYKEGDEKYSHLDMILVEFTEDFTCENLEEKLTFGHIEIYQDDLDEDYLDEDYWGEDDWYEDINEEDEEDDDVVE